ncbi:MAG TPA: hypothetical protein VNL18_12390 [Gemmatimonadales bacterium]|nr:hypothetical protein [Gemmatimonadales bacterium]
MTSRLALALLPLIAVRPVAAQVTLQANAGFLDRRLSDGGAVEQQAGFIAGGGIALGMGRVAFSLSAVGGKLRAPTDRLTEDADYTRIAGELTVPLAPPVALSAGVVGSVFVTRVGAQRWITPRVSLELRAPFTSIPATAYFAGSAIVGPSTNAAASPKGGMAIRAGVAGRPPVALFVEYQLERLAFEGIAPRQEQRGEVLVGIRITPRPQASKST